MNKSASNTVRLTLDPSNLPPLTEAQRAQLAEVAAMPDERIDYSDAPPLPNAVWIKAVDAISEPKKQVTLRIDADVIDFFKHTGKRYQTRINAVLRAYVEASKKAHS